ncbi:LPXTG cell wall anchor domain-containing protein [Staphylococcus sp. NRL 16/872]|nr:MULTISPECIES: LPXTG cell wall anchor domain-containing protein [unclassified Staphylococcus]MCJ1656128.1 MSCRAMM family adhesin SdrC [Staphylococcus sp. NRL 21/187]MCJ1661912.1 MSCRAMM family adhesin SdrC [Staphylococcus sp. NRL 18/288]MCJ1667946.1 MSCRAMM family adhesin SdrC [Staphylococcus sp. NRL 19/737]WEN70573.1 LPXTG cell wall anchor domain-containing protein [Staphylococcus sp. NRL 16/872]
MQSQQQVKNTTKALPETGELSNSGLVTIIASVLLAAGSLLTFKRFSNNK